MRCIRNTAGQNKEDAKKMPVMSSADQDTGIAAHVSCSQHTAAATVISLVDIVDPSSISVIIFRYFVIAVIW